MDLKSVSGLTFFVKDIANTAEFYKKLGFKIEKQEKDYLLVRLNWFSLDFVVEGKPNGEPKGGGLCINISVGDVDEFYKNVLDKGLKPAGEPQDYPEQGVRNFIIHDPDGYNLVIFKRGLPRNAAE